jgi:hypothetical protein
MIASHSCGTRWVQVGNRTGHCAACHRTFSGLRAFDDHQSIRDGKNVCTDPGTLLDKAGEPRYRTFTDRADAVVWRSTAEQPPDAWPKRAPNRSTRTPPEPRNPAEGTRGPRDDSDAPEGQVTA